jgi:hypothetical protein
MNPTFPITYEIIKFILTNEKFSQTDIHERTNASIGQVNKVVKWLITRKFIEKDGKRYRVVDPSGIVALFPLFRNMNDLLACSIPVRGSTDDIIAIIPKDGILCLDTALNRYSKYFRSDRICIYHEKPDSIGEMLKPYSGGLVNVYIYHPDMNLKNDAVNGATSKLRTIIDMACDGRVYAAKDLFNQLWGIRFG